LEASIDISYRNRREAKAVADAVAPDNVKTPKGLSVQTTVQSVKVSTKIVCQTRLETFIATIDDLLSAVSVAEKSLSSVKQ
jgi:hypothetical protein